MSPISRAAAWYSLKLLCILRISNVVQIYQFFLAPVYVHLRNTHVSVQGKWCVNCIYIYILLSPSFRHLNHLTVEEKDLFSHDVQCCKMVNVTYVPLTAEYNCNNSTQYTRPMLVRTPTKCECRNCNYLHFWLTYYPWHCHKIIFLISWYCINKYNYYYY
jgi:hypothetical protein